MQADAFVRLALRARRDPTARAALSAAFAGLDWPAVIALANRERVTPLVYQTVKELPVPAQVLAQLQAIFHESLRANVLRFRYLDMVLPALSARGIAVILLKGAALAEPVYGNVALRPMTDLDLLIPEEQVFAAVSALTGLGFIPETPAQEIRTDLAADCEVELIHPEDPKSFVELHWNILHQPYYRGKFDARWLWQTARPVRVGAQNALALCPEAEILHICAHACLHHAGDELIWQNDLAELTGGEMAVDWPLLFQKALEAELVPALQTVLPPAAADLGAPIPADILRQLDALPVTRQERNRYRRAIKARETSAGVTVDFMLGLPGWRARLDFAVENLFPSPATMRKRYNIPHPLLTPFYYPYRWIKGLLRRA